MKIERMDSEPYTPTLKDIQPGQCFLDNNGNGKETVYIMTNYNLGANPNFKSFVELETGRLLTAEEGREVQPCNCKVVVGNEK